MNLNLTILGQMITFALFIWFTMKFVWPVLTQAMEERRQKIADGLAAAVCHFYNQDRPDNSKTYSGWKAFINHNPKKIKSG